MTRSAQRSPAAGPRMQVVGGRRGTTARAGGTGGGHAKIPSLDGMRALAVLVVFVGHGTVVGSAWPGHLGVTIFFFLSGYLITTLLRREHDRTGRISLGRFYLRRALRILPPAYLAIATSVVLGATGVLAATTTGWGVLAEVLHVTNYYIAFAGRDGLPPESTMLWSLAVEEHFYLIFPLVLLLLLRRRLGPREIGRILLATALVVPVWRVVAGMQGAGFDRLYVSTDTRIDSLLYGCAMALLWNPVAGDQPPVRERLLRLLAPMALLVLVASAMVPSHQFRLGVADVVQCLCLIPIFWTVITRPGGLAGRLLNHPAVAFVGVLSFSIYLFHRMAIAVVDERIAWSPAVDGVALLATVAIAYLVHRLVESPLARVRRRLEQDTRGRHAADRAPNGDRRTLAA